MGCTLLVALYFLFFFNTDVDFALVKAATDGAARVPLEAGETGSGLRGARTLKCKRGKFQLLSAVPVRRPAFKNGGGGGGRGGGLKRTNKKHTRMNEEFRIKTKE